MVGEREKEFEFRVHNPKENRDINYRVKKTAEGWHVSYRAHNGECKADGSPVFLNNFEQDRIIYPSKFGLYMEYLWEEAERENFSDDDLQVRLQQIADWVSQCTKSAPSW